MTSPKRSLHPANGKDQGALLGALELVARGGMLWRPSRWAFLRAGQVRRIQLGWPTALWHGSQGVDAALIE